MALKLIWHITTCISSEYRPRLRQHHLAAHRAADQPGRERDRRRQHRADRRRAVVQPDRPLREHRNRVGDQLEVLVGDADLVGARGARERGRCWPDGSAARRGGEVRAREDRQPDGRAERRTPGVRAREVRQPRRGFAR